MLSVKRIPLSRAAILVFGLVLGAGSSARAEPGTSGQMFQVNSGRCQTSARYQNLHPIGALGESSIDRGGRCWHWVKLWIWDEHGRRTITRVAQGTGAALNILPVGPLRNACRSQRGSQGFYVTKAEFGACGSTGHCTKRTISPPKMPTWNC